MDKITIARGYPNSEWWETIINSREAGESPPELVPLLDNRESYIVVSEGRSEKIKEWAMSLPGWDTGLEEPCPALWFYEFDPEDEADWESRFEEHIAYLTREAYQLADLARQGDSAGISMITEYIQEVFFDLAKLVMLGTVRITEIAPVTEDLQAALAKYPDVEEIFDEVNNTDIDMEPWLSELCEWKERLTHLIGLGMRDDSEAREIIMDQIIPSPMREKIEGLIKLFGSR